MNEENNNNDNRWQRPDSDFGSGQHFDPPPYYNRPPQTGVPVQKKNGKAVAAFCISLANFIVFRSILSFILVPIAVILAILSLKKHEGGKAFPVISLILSAISTLIFAFYVVLGVKLYPEVKYFAEHDDAIISEYEKTGQVPEHYEKFQGKEYDFIWSNMGFDDFDGFFKFFVELYKGSSIETSDSSKNSSESKKPDSSETETTTGKDIDHSGEELVILS